MSNKTGESGINKTATLKDVEKSTQEYNYLTGRKSDYVYISIYIILTAFLFQYMNTIFKCICNLQN